MTVGERKHFGVTHVTVAACDHNLVTRQPGVHVIGQTQNRINITCNTLISSSFSVTLPQASIYQPAHNEIFFFTDFAIVGPFTDVWQASDKI